MAKQPTPLHYDNDPECIRIAIERIKERGYDLKRPSPYHLKVGATNFYPTTGKITIDPAIVHPGKGLEEYLELLERMIQPKIIHIYTTR